MQRGNKMIKLSDRYRSAVKHITRKSSPLSKDHKWWYLHGVTSVILYDYQGQDYDIMLRLRRKYV